MYYASSRKPQAFEEDSSMLSMGDYLIVGAAGASLTVIGAFFKEFKYFTGYFRGCQTASDDVKLESK
jgi:hypothetical protein